MRLRSGGGGKLSCGTGGRGREGSSTVVWRSRSSVI